MHTSGVCGNFIVRQYHRQSMVLVTALLLLLVAALVALVVALVDLVVVLVVLLVETGYVNRFTPCN